MSGTDQARAQILEYLALCIGGQKYLSVRRELFSLGSLRCDDDFCCYFWR